MGGMFTTLKVRKGLARHDYKDPGWYKHPAGTVAYEWKGEAAAMPEPVRAPDTKAMAAKPGEKVLKVVKPVNHQGH
jgi:hypothetical protein